MDLKTVIKKYEAWADHNLAQHVANPNIDIDYEDRQLKAELILAWQTYQDEKGFSEFNLTLFEWQHVLDWLKLEPDNFTWLQRLLRFQKHNDWKGF